MKTKLMLMFLTGALALSAVAPSAMASGKGSPRALANAVTTKKTVTRQQAPAPRPLSNAVQKGKKGFAH